MGPSDDSLLERLGTGWGGAVWEHCLSFQHDKRLFSGCVILGKWLHYSEPESCLLQNVDNSSNHLPALVSSSMPST